MNPVSSNGNKRPAKEPSGAWNGGCWSPIGMGVRAGLAWCLTALAIGACATDDREPPVATRKPANLATTAKTEAPARQPTAPAPRAATVARTHDAVAVDLAGSGEPLIAVAGCQDANGNPVVPLYAQRNGGWRRIAEGEWPAGDGSEVQAIDARDLDADGVPELIAQGRGEDSDGANRSRLAVYRLRAGDLELVPEARGDGPGGDISLSDPATSRRGDHQVVMSLPDPAGAMRVVVRAAGGGPSMLGTIQKWNAELARLRPR